MRILFSSLPTHGHTYPLLPLAAAARKAGHEVVYATGADFHPVLTALDLEPVAAGMPISEAFAIASKAAGVTDPRKEGPEAQERVIAGVFGSALPRRFLADLRDVVTPGSFDLVVHEAGNPGAGLAARRAGIPGLCHGFGRVVSAGLGDRIAGSLGELAAEIGETVPDRYANILGNPYLDIYPPSLQGPDFRATGDRVELRPVPFAEPGQLPEVVGERDRPLVYLTLGTAFGTADVLSTAIEGLSGLDVRVLVSGGRLVEAAALGQLPENVTAVSWLPQADLLPHLDLIVHHGGSGTTLGALGAGVKQLLTPQGADQFNNAEAVVDGGAALSLQPGELSPEAIADGARKLLEGSEFDAPVRALAQEVAAMPSPEEIAARLPEFAG
ncbi:glycosyltransferase family 1 protein [Saccharopolyspora erythraea]|uniref:glycosyltransferase n=1 Tax=Saccharopolyspora erythraea TaxID=1836 RepID=UPI001BA4A470|nr:glycosyltransferase [Saccharopolyspora erythraea]QUH01555.1 glycosyltransferase family 1 protein [Saccharopolyspora erythraea]